MAVYQLRLSHGLNLKSWIRQLALQLEPQIPAPVWPSLYPNKGVRVLILSKALREALLTRLTAFDFCGSQVQCDEACEPVERNHNQERYQECHGSIPVDRYQVVARSAVDLARELLDHVLKRVPDAAPLGKALLRLLTAEVAKHLFTNELCGRTDLCQFSAPRDLSAELARDPGPAEIEGASNN